MSDSDSDGSDDDETRLIPNELSTTVRLADGTPAVFTSEGTPMEFIQCFTGLNFPYLADAPIIQASDWVHTPGPTLNTHTHDLLHARRFWQSSTTSRLSRRWCAATSKLQNGPTWPRPR